MAQTTERYVVTAFFTADGYAAYLKQDGSWSRSFDEAATWNESESNSQIEDKSANDQRAVCDPYSFKVNIVEGKAQPITARETIRSQGPTTRVRRPDVSA